VQSFDRPNPHAVLPPLGEVAVFPGFVTCLPSQPTRRRLLPLNKHRSPKTGGCPRCQPRTSTTFPLPLLLIESLPLAQTRQSHPLGSTVRRTSSHATLGGRRTSQSGFGLAIRLVVDGHHTRLRPTACPRFPTLSPRKLLGSDGASTSHTPIFR